jgi:hypothetical protein
MQVTLNLAMSAVADTLVPPPLRGRAAKRTPPAFRAAQPSARQRATIFILNKVRAFTQSAGKSLLVVLNYTARTDHFRGSVVTWNGIRRGQEIVDDLSASGVPLFDMNAVHQREYEQTGGSYHEYMSRYMVGGDGHYNPHGNHFFAYTIKDRLLELLDPKPLPYQEVPATAVT